MAGFFAYSEFQTPRHKIRMNQAVSEADITNKLQYTYNNSVILDYCNFGV